MQNDVVIDIIQLIQQSLSAAVVAPGALAIAIFMRQRREAFAGPMLAAIVVGLAISWLIRRWDASGLHIMPIGMVAAAGISAGEFVDGSLKRALRRGAVIAAWVWLSTLIVDLSGCYVEPACRMRDTGGDGWLDGIVMNPAAALLLSVVLWCVLGWPKRRAERRKRNEADGASGQDRTGI